MLLEFVGQSSRDADFIAASPERLVNLYPEPLPEGGRARFQLKSVLGAEEWVSLPGVFIRAIEAIGYTDSGAIRSALYAVIGGKLYEISQAGGYTEIGAVADDEMTTLAGHDGALTAVAGGTYYLWDGASLTQPTAGAFSDFGSVEFLGGYTILTQRGGRMFQWSALADPSDLPGLNFATAEARDDALLRAIAVSGNLWLFKTSSIEIWARTGLANEEAFAMMPGGVIERGLAGFNLVTKVPDGAFFVGSDGKAYITAGAQLRPVSTPAVETAIQQGTPTHCFYYTDEGHEFCVVRFRDRPAWVFDIATGLWHERATGTGAWRATGAVKAYGAWRAGDDLGRVATLGRLNRDVNEPLVREATSRTLYAGPRFRVPSVEFYGRVGRSALTRPAKMMVRFSRDGGLTWGAEREVSMGRQGHYEQRMVLRSVGQCRSLTARVRITDPADLTLLSVANVETA